MPRYEYRRYPYETPPELRGAPAERRPVIIVGAGPVGLTAAIDLALHGIPSLVLDDNDVVSVGSRAICWAKRTLEIFDRLGVGQRMLDKGVTWKVGRLYHGEHEVYAFDLLPEDGHRMPAFINLQQYYVEQYLVERARDFPDLIELRWKNEVTGVERRDDGVTVTIETPDGAYALECDWLLACDGVRSPVRAMLGLEFAGRVFEERFLIADVELKADFPSERRFWFEPPFHDGRSALLHKQPDDIYRIDLQLPPDADPEVEARHENVIPRIRAVVKDLPFEIDWVSVYTFQCRRLERFLHGRVIFAGDSAHVVSPFGARGGNGGIQDVDNLVWKLAAVIRGAAPASLLETYDEERIRGADENILNSARTTSFMTPKTANENRFRAAALDLADDLPFARKLVNSGRLSVPCHLDGCALQTPDDLDSGLAPGSPCLDAPVANGDGEWLLHHLGGDFCLLGIGAALPDIGLRRVQVAPFGANAAPADAVRDLTGHATRRYGEGLGYLIRPDQHVAARFAAPDAAAARRALARAQGGAA